MRSKAKQINCMHLLSKHVNQVPYVQMQAKNERIQIGQVRLWFFRLYRHRHRHHHQRDEKVKSISAISCILLCDSLWRVLKRYWYGDEDGQAVDA